MATMEGRPERPHVDLTKLKRIAAPHLDSFNYFLKDGIQQAVADIDPVEIEHNDQILHCASTRAWPVSISFVYFCI